MCQRMVRRHRIDESAARPVGSRCKPAVVPGSITTPSARSASPEPSASSVPDSVSSRSLRRVGGRECKESLGTAPSPWLGDHAVDRDRELRFPAGGHALDAVGHRIDLVAAAAGLRAAARRRPRSAAPGASCGRTAARRARPRSAARGRSGRWAPGPARGPRPRSCRACTACSMARASGVRTSRGVGMAAIWVQSF